MNINIKKFFKLVECRKSQAKNVHAWYWTFQSLQNEYVQIKVTTYTKEDKPFEHWAWEELKRSCLISAIYKYSRKKKLNKMGVGGKRK